MKKKKLEDSGIISHDDKTGSGRKKTDNENTEVLREKEADAVSAGDFPIVGIGASAGGLAAFEAFFSAMPSDTDPGMAFVLVQHLAPDHKSILSELIQRYTAMQVFEVTDGMEVRPNCAYIIPPNRDMAFLNGTLQLLEPTAPRGQRLPIDFFFRSLARDLRERAICIVLSGTGSDGTLGVRAVKGEGGMVMVQNPNSAEYDGMPRSAIATGLADYELPPAEMPAALLAYAAHAYGKPRAQAEIELVSDENYLKKIFILLRAHTGHDFSLYKPNTINRRIERRMAVRQFDTLEEYVRYLQHNPSEVEALFRDLLIGVTNFFRDIDAFNALEKQAVPRLFTDRPADAAIRVWVPGCSTGEEAYSIAILIAEYQESIRQSYKVQVFATDIDSNAVAAARTGIYPASIASDITPERLARFFTIEPDGSAYRIHKMIRDMLIFSEQNVITDPPFSKLDLICCRNLLIYMNGYLQKKLIPLFHYALNPGGILFLGTSETVGEFSDLFSTIDRKLKLYQRKDDFQGTHRGALPRYIPPMTPSDSFSLLNQGKAETRKKLPLREVTEQALLKQLAPAAALVNSHGDVLYLHGRTGLYLEPAPGEAGINNILKMAREGLRRDLATTLHKAASSKTAIISNNLRVKTNGSFTLVNLTVCPVTQGETEGTQSSAYLVIMQEAPVSEHEKILLASYLSGESSETANAPADSDAMDSDTRIMSLKQELKAKEEYLQSIIEELEISNEELKSSNEEMQSVTEEFQSTTEELETSKEELQSVNEELSTVNAELQTKLADLSRANNDMNNLLAGTGIATIFVDHMLNIQHFTPAARHIMNLVLGDVGRPMDHITTKLAGYDSIMEDTRSVLDTLIPRELEVQTRGGIWYMMRILPYRTLENVIEGAVITFVDITDRKRAEDELLKKANDQLRLAVVVHDANDAITMQDLEGRILAWNPCAERMYGYSEDEALSMNISELIPASQREEALSLVKKLSRSMKLEPYRMQRIKKDGIIIDVWLTATALIDNEGEMYGIATTEREISSDS